ncbi:MAG: SDR family NAD(P)-dependent oxidoreductase [Anaerolineaceae bacterium]|jgi:NAD(P)-dependent dehydrogenase (short-subunit alcohol dehydrogenase family)|nr:SDR family NAD(P)-dependent oxidoreductase [Anaerolineaceae bacterium]
MFFGRRNGVSEFNGKVVIVTGASSGVGRSSALFYAREGAKVVVSDNNEEEGQKTVRLIQEAKGEAFFVKTDITNPVDCENLVRVAVEKYSCQGYPEGIAEVVVWLSSP